MKYLNSFKSHFIIRLSILIGLLLPIHTIFAQLSNWHIETKFTSQAKTVLYSSPTEDSHVNGEFEYLSKIVVLIKDNDSPNFGWCEIIYPQKGFVKKSLLITEEQAKFRNTSSTKKHHLVTTWEPEVFENDYDYTFVKESSSFSSATIGVLKNDEQVLTINDKLNENNVWLKIIYPYEGYIRNDGLSNEPSYPFLGIGGYYGFYADPYEKNFSNYRNPFGFFIEFGKTNWNLLFRLGYGNSQSNISEYILKNQEIYLNISYTLYKLFNNKIDIYALAGGNYWFSTFQNTKYPTLTEYFPEEKDNGIGYQFGAGINYNIFSAFNIGVEYIFWNSKEAVFGEIPEPGEFTNQYVLYPGANQVSINVKYRFIFK